MLARTVTSDQRSEAIDQRSTVLENINESLLTNSELLPSPDDSIECCRPTGVRYSFIIAVLLILLL